MAKMTSLAFFIAVLAIVTAALLYVTQIDREARFFFHLDLVFFELFFIPVVLGCLWMGTTGGLLTALGVAILLLPYLVLHWEGLSAADPNRILRILVYFLASVVLGKAVHRQREEQNRAMETQPLAAIGKSMAIVAHDMKTPLIAIGGFSAFVLRKLDPDFPHRDKLEIVVEEARRLERMIKDMLAYCRVSWRGDRDHR